MLMLQGQTGRILIPINAVPVGATSALIDKAAAGPTVPAGAFSLPATDSCAFLDPTAADTNTLGTLAVFVIDSLGHVVGGINVEIVASLGGLDAAATRAAIGLAAANLDTQLAAISALVTAAAIRVALGLGAANLDTQLAGILARLLATAIRADIGMAAANLDTQLAAIAASSSGVVVE